MKQGGFLSLTMAFLLASYASAHAQQTIDPKQAQAAFAEVKQLSERDGGKLWHKPLYGPLLFVDPVTNAIVTNQQDANGTLRMQDGVFLGSLPPKTPVANTSFDFSGTHWTMIMWPLPDDTYPRDKLMAHESFHRLQNSLNIPMSDARNPHLDTLEGRLWLELEWRALAAALVSRGDAQTQAVRDAAAFRAHRHELFADSADNERRLDLNEGLAEYTGTVIAAHDRNSAIWHAVGKLSDPSSQNSFVRGFSYTSGPAYGLLLDVRMPGWREKITPQSDIAEMLATTVRALPAAEVKVRAAVYGEADLRVAETNRDQKRETLRRKYRAQLVDGPTLTLPTSERLVYSFDPNTLLPLDDKTTVFPMYIAKDDWGSIEANDGLLTSPGKLVVSAPRSPEGVPGKTIEASGWKLTLSPGWSMAPGTCNGCFVVVKH